MADLRAWDCKAYSLNQFHMARQWGIVWGRIEIGFQKISDDCAAMGVLKPKWLGAGRARSPGSAPLTAILSQVQAPSFRLLLLTLP
jgi:hypothetical protein